MAPRQVSSFLLTVHPPSTPLTGPGQKSINQLPINDDTSAGGVAPRSSDNGSWIPPVYSNGFGPQVTGNLYRWESNGTISPALDCQWVNGSFMSRETAERDSHEIQLYCTRTVFWCDPWAQFMVATGDSSSRHMQHSEEPHNRWWPLTFEHDRAMSRVVESGPSQYLAGSGAAWIADLGLLSHVPRRAPAATGLSGNLAILMGIIALSCPAEYFDTVLTTDRPLRRNRWRGHNRGDGRSNERGVVVHIYLDPENPLGSTMSTLPDLEADGPAIIT
ncbi:hypothetical protein DL95DRAFT_435416 [Leptodontidium sp. 2 PMI_412]|nr:hypothetical protein DL95DRAFT_435416 [Leptodontidium sp. 2 PMI_412]